MASTCGCLCKVPSWLRAFSLLCLLTLCAIPAHAGCPEGDSSPITSGQAADGPPVVFSLEALSGASFFLIGECCLWPTPGHSGTLPPDAWLVNLGDLEGSGRLYFRIEAPGEGPGGWGDPRTEGCPSSSEPAPHPPLGVVLYERQGDPDKDGAWDVFEDINRNGILEPGEDRDGDGRLTFTGNGCEGFLREDRDCDGRLDRYNEDLNGNGILDIGEDLDGDHHLDDGTEDRNHNGQLDDRPFPSPGDTVPDETGTPNPRYPYGTLRPDAGAVIAASVAWNGTAYDFSAINTPTRLITLQDGRQFRVVDPTPGERLIPKGSGVHIWRGGVQLEPLGFPALQPAWRLSVESGGLDLHDDMGGRRAIFDYYTINDYYGYFYSSTGDGAGRGFLWLTTYDWPPILGRFTPMRGTPTSSRAHVELPPFVELRILNPDWDGMEKPLDSCPEVPSCGFFPGECGDANFDGIGDACDPAQDPQATVESAWRETGAGPNPGERLRAASAYDARRGVVVLFGGSEDVRTWEYDDASWRSVVTAVAPDARSGHRMVYDSLRGRVLLFGGRLLSDAASERPLGLRRLSVDPTADRHCSPGALGLRPGLRCRSRPRRPLRRVVSDRFSGRHLDVRRLPVEENSGPTITVSAS